MSEGSARRCPVVAAVVVLGMSLAGCSGSSAPQTGRSEDATREVTLELIAEADFATVLEGHRGKVVLVDFWATWCDDCMKLFPHTVQLHKRHVDQGLVVISVDFDDPDDDRATALEFLTKKGATFQNFISQYGAGTKSAEAFDLDGALPQMKLYDRQGRLHKSFGGELGEIDPEQLDRAVEELLGKT